MATKAKKLSEKEIQAQYFSEARSWETTRVLELEKAAKRGWWVGIAGAAIGLAGVFAVAALTPLKQIEYGVIRVNDATGAVQSITTLRDGKENYSETINSYFARWYVRYREGYAKDLAEEYYYATGLLSGPIEQKRYFDSFNPKNPMSPLNVYSDYARVKVSIKSVSFIQPQVALVRYTRLIERGSDRPELSHWAATLTFRYSKAPISQKDREINPLGFQVIEYRNDPDSGTEGGRPQPAQASTEAVIGTSTVTLSPGEQVQVPAVTGQPQAQPAAQAPEAAGTVPAAR